MMMMNDQEKSGMLAKAMGWHSFIGVHTMALFIRTPDGLQRDGNFYAPRNMALAWRVHIWAIESKTIWQEYNHWCKENQVHNSMIAPFWCFEDAQRLWLDKIIELIEETNGTSTDNRSES